jgi:hypothetical protein
MRFTDFEECPHTNVSPPRARWIANGSIQYRFQCLGCGEPVGNPASKEGAFKENRGQTPTPFDEELLSHHRSLTEEARRRDRAEWWEWYDDYLKSEEWARRWQKVLERACGICEGCRERRAQHIHHLTYKHAGNELLFELVALCWACHQMAHSEAPV